MLSAAHSFPPLVLKPAPQRKTNLWSSRLRRLLQKRWMQFFFFFLSFFLKEETLQDLVAGGSNTRTLQNEALRRFVRSFVDDDVRIYRPVLPSPCFYFVKLVLINKLLIILQNNKGFQWRTRSFATKQA